tara:strand:- start:46 stop:348 length:303 start_codon:yes stop_codon:yes gene_type:complete
VTVGFMLIAFAVKGIDKYKIIPSEKNIKYVVFLPIKSDIEAQKILPIILKTLIIKTYVPAKPAVTICGRLGVKISIIIVLATPITPIPAVTLKHKTIHKK